MMIVDGVTEERQTVVKNAMDSISFCRLSPSKKVIAVFGRHQSKSKIIFFNIFGIKIHELEIKEVGIVSFNWNLGGLSFVLCFQKSV